MSFLTYLPLGGNKSEEKYVPVCNFVIEQKGNSHLDQPLMNSRKEMEAIVAALLPPTHAICSLAVVCKLEQVNPDQLCGH